MKLEDFQLELTQLPNAMPVWHGRVDARQWRTASQQVRDKGGRLVALWAADNRDRGAAFSVHAALTVQSGLLVITLPLHGESFPDVSDIFPGANRMQRAAYDLFGVKAENAADRRKWLRHAAWRAEEFPLRKDFISRPPSAVTGSGEADDYPFVRVEGEGVHEIPVGPVHAGTIEPGHFRFSIVGEGILRLEERLGYKHKGIEKRFESMTLAEGAKLAGRVSGDSTVAYAWAYAMAVEGITGVTPPPRALWLRALLLERERVGQHLWDLGFLGNDAGLAFGLAQFSRLREDWLRVSQMLFGHRYLMDAIIPGGVARDIDAHGVVRMRDEISAVGEAVALLKNIYDEHAGLQDRFITCGRVKPDLADRLGLTGLAGRASGVAWDLRVQFPPVPYDSFDTRMATHRNGDVAARVTVRFEEIAESLRLIGLILSDLPGGDIARPVPDAPENALGIGWVEGWRGEVLIALESGAGNRIRRLHPHDPSWQNWPLLERAVLGNIVPDFPLINKSFNLSYSGQDL
ncbi:MAG TPA: NADH-quinone oxidoreductase subunit C [Burkholderiales bacterium]|nr:NADH-quinone oxidoreductase subunit C [Burkholderiales bacterium]